MNTNKTINAIYRAGYSDYEGLDTYRAFPTRNVPIEALDPFLFLNHHGHQVYKPNNAGLPFGPHPHKGFETVTFIVEGDLIHKDSTGFTSNIKAGGIQWMTAGRGIIHSEQSSDEFKASGGALEILQLWVNLPAKHKNAPPKYIGLQKDEVPAIKLNNDAVVHLASGSWGEVQAPIQSIADVHLSTIELKEGAQVDVTIPAERSVLFYVIKGAVTVNGETAETHDLVEFNKEGENIQIQAAADTLLLLGHAQPNHEPIVAHGPFVMNTQEEIRQAFVAYQQGQFGTWQD
ncbi:pirin family protein [Flavisolibacter tropicus]|uniref:Nuclease PIN n=1 Tax=Flavisolibacter tropicus TaxID=1492898 RepID=A0A172TWC3_9BACT|nr:pirin family protein [Flavisolibacter tropicus]ANE51330.1 nuclease PIN [Flavisolibacter tropicus]